MAASGQPGLRTYWYDSAEDSVGPSERQRKIGRIDDVKLRLGRRAPDGRQKGVDGLILRDLMTMGRQQSISHAFLLSGDGDLVEGVRVAQDAGVHVTLMSIRVDGRNNVAFDLRLEVDREIRLGRHELSPYLRRRRPHPPAAGHRGPGRQPPAARPAPTAVPTPAPPPPISAGWTPTPRVPAPGSSSWPIAPSAAWSPDPGFPVAESTSEPHPWPPRTTGDGSRPDDAATATPEPGDPIEPEVELGVLPEVDPEVDPGDDPEDPAPWEWPAESAQAQEPTESTGPEAADGWRPDPWGFVEPREPDPFVAPARDHRPQPEPPVPAVPTVPPAPVAPVVPPEPPSGLFGRFRRRR
jgi:hypothetical protein